MRSCGCLSHDRVPRNIEVAPRPTNHDLHETWVRLGSVEPVGLTKARQGLLRLEPILIGAVFVCPRSHADQGWASLDAHGITAPIAPVSLAGMFRAASIGTRSHSGHGINHGWARVVKARPLESKYLLPATR